MMQPHSTLSILKINKKSFNVLNILSNTCTSLDERNHCAIFLDSKNLNGFKHQIESLIKKYFSEYIKNNQLFIFNLDNDCSPTECIKQNPVLIKYDWFIILDIDNIYLPNYLRNINRDINLYKDRYHKLKINNISKDNNDLKILSNEVVHSMIDNNPSVQKIYEDHEIIAEYYLKNVQEKQFIDETNFALVWMNEKESSRLNSGYSFWYKRNDKVFNISNECAGIVKNITEKSIEIIWTLDEINILHQYLLNNSQYDCVSENG